jgi:HEAT repeat protein
MSMEQRSQHELIRDLAKSGDEQSMLRICEFAEHRDQFIRTTAMEAIGRHKLGRQQMGALRKGLGDASAYVNRAACEAVGNLELHELRATLKPLLRNLEPATRMAAIATLSQIWDDGDFDEVFERFTRDNVEDVRKSAAHVLNIHAAERNWLGLFEVFSKDDIPRHRVWACQLAQRFSGIETVQALNRLQSDKDGHVRAAAYSAIKMLSGLGEAPAPL